MQADSSSCDSVQRGHTNPFFSLTWTDFFDLLVYRGFFGVPVYHLVIEIGLIIWVIRLFTARRMTPQTEAPLTEKEKDQLIEEWQPEPLVKERDESEMLLPRPILDGKLTKHAKVYVMKGDKEHEISCLNVASFNFLDFVAREDVESAARETISLYGVGSCGPRGFYGTAEIHLQLEKRIAKFFDLQEAALYSFGFATISSAIPSYSKRGDVIFADEGVCFAIQQGIKASRSHVRYFKHNDMKHLKELLDDQALLDKKDPGRAAHTRKFLIVEGLYSKYGDICPLPDLVALKDEFKLRLLVDETLSLGTLGAHGRGVTEHFGISARSVDAIIGSLENAIPAGGGFVVGSSYVVDHQRLSGSGYCFSASLPPLLAACALQCIDILDNDESIVRELESKSLKLHSLIRENSVVKRCFTLEALELSPIKHLRLVDVRGKNWYKTENLLREMCNWVCENKQVLLTTAAYCEKSEHIVPQPSIRLSVNRSFTDEEIHKIVDALQCVCKQFLV